MNLNIHAIIPQSLANGPGRRFTIWFQGCTLNCPDCFNPETHSHTVRTLMPIPEILSQLGNCQPESDGVSISGGEPFQQSAGLLELVRAIRLQTRVSILVFSGYTLAEIDRQPHGKDILTYIDVLIAGRYQAADRVGEGLLSSTNQTLHLLSSRYSLSDFSAVPPIEIQIDPGGLISQTGFFSVFERTSPHEN